MCGFVGVIKNYKEGISEKTLKAMTAMIAHRGPDGEGIYTGRSVGFGHRRLAVIDLSSAASQPMVSNDGRYVIVYNGEIYNFKILRRELKEIGYCFKSRSDTEVVLNAMIEWDVNALERFNGMFSFITYDRKEKRILIARDRYGIKPLYIATVPEGYLFGSEIKAFLKHPGFQVDVDLEALDEYFTFQNMLSHKTLFKNVNILAPGTCRRYKQVSGKWVAESSQIYWDFDFQPDKDIGNFDSVSRHLHKLLKQSVHRQMISDVPLGSYLSGGIDSGSIVALASERIKRLTTFTGGFDLSSAQGMESGYDERAAAEVLSNQFKTEHYEMVLHAGDMAYVIPKLVWHLEDLRLGQCYPNYFLARLASKFVKVVLCGTGGDELFAGYPWRYFGSANSLDEKKFLKNYYGFWQRLVPDDLKKRLFRPGAYRFMNPAESFNTFCEVFTFGGIKRNGIEGNINQSLYFETKSFLHGLLVVGDKLSMAHGLETRVPFLDNDLVDYACKIPVWMKLNNLKNIPRIDENELGKSHHYHLKTNNGKRILRHAIESIVPNEVMERVKQGFSSPDVSWYRGESLDYVRTLLLNRKACIYEYLEMDFVKQVIESHLSGKQNQRLLIWSFLCLEWWLRRFYLS